MSGFKTVKAVAKVQLTVEVELTRPWRGEETMANAHRSAGSDGEDIVRRAIGSDTSIRIVGKPRVSLVTFEKEEA